MQTLNVVQITDIHLLSQPGSTYYDVDTSLSLDSVLACLNDLKDKLDMCIITGDLAEDGALETYQRLNTKMLKLNVPVYVLPGNHDNTDHMDSVFCMDQGVGNSNVEFVRSVVFDNWGFLFLNSQVFQQSFGRIGTEQLKTVSDFLIEHADKPVLIALHHPSFRICPTKGCQLQDADELHKLLAKHHNVKVIVAGHTHNDRQDLSKSYVQYVTPSSFAFAEHKQKLIEHNESDFWAGHQLNADKIGLRILKLHASGGVESEIKWAAATKITSKIGTDH